MDNNELALRNRLLYEFLLKKVTYHCHVLVNRFAEALFEATEYCSDGIEITSVSPDFRLVVRNIILNLCCIILNPNNEVNMQKN